MLQARIDYKICVLCFKCINKSAPSYLSDLLEQYVPSRLLRSGSQNLLKIPPRANKKCTEKAFKHCAPYIWNSLSSDIREAKSESHLKRTLGPTFSSPIFVFEFLSHWYIWLISMHEKWMCLYLIVLLLWCNVAVTDYVKHLEPFKGLGAI